MQYIFEKKLKKSQKNGIKRKYPQEIAIFTEKTPLNFIFLSNPHLSLIFGRK